MLLRIAIFVLLGVSIISASANAEVGEGMASETNSVSSAGLTADDECAGAEMDDECALTALQMRRDAKHEPVGLDAFGRDRTVFLRAFPKPKFPKDASSVAVLLRGQLFHGCHIKYGSAQKEAMRSMMTKVVWPLERHGIKVHVFVSYSPCNLDEYILPILREKSELDNSTSDRQVRTRVLPSPDQPTGVRNALDFLKDEVSPDAVNGTYQLVIVARHDLIYISSIEQWDEVNFSVLNFASRCENKTNYFHCVNDVLFIMPADVFPVFDEAVGTGSCFNATQPKTNGHGCLSTLESIGPSGGFIGSSFVVSWQPTVNIRQKNVWFYPFPL